MTGAARQLRHLLQLNTVMLAFIMRGAGFVVLFWFEFVIFNFWKSSEALWWDGEGYRLPFMRETEQMSLRTGLTAKQKQDFFCNSWVETASKKYTWKKKTVFCVL